MNKIFNDLHAFLIIARLGNFTKAAKQLNVSPSALSHLINGLEERLEVQLLKRTTRSVSTTQAGQELFEQIEPMFSGIKEQVRELGKFKDTTIGKVRLNISENTAFNIIYPKLKDFLPHHPELEVEIFINNDKIDIVADRFDIGVRSGGDVAQDMIAHRIAPDFKMCTVVAPNYFEEHEIPKTPYELKNHLCIGLSITTNEHFMHWEYQQNGNIIKPTLNYNVTVNSNLLSKNMALDGIAISWLPEHMITSELASGKLIEILCDYAVTYPGHYLYFPKSRYKSSALQALINLLKI